VPGWSWKEHPEDYSGKHHTTGRSLILAARPDGSLEWVSDPLPGSHPRPGRDPGTRRPRDARRRLGRDKGFIGPDPIITPVQKLPDQERLDDHHRESDRQVYSVCAPTERAIANLKTWRILHTDYRRPHHTHPETISAVLGLEFYRMTL
jgi:hypothetical protein